MSDLGRWHMNTHALAHGHSYVSVFEHYLFTISLECCYWWIQLNDEIALAPSCSANGACIEQCGDHYHPSASEISTAGTTSSTQELSSSGEYDDWDPLSLKVIINEIINIPNIIAPGMPKNTQISNLLMGFLGLGVGDVVGLVSTVRASSTFGWLSFSQCPQCLHFLATSNISPPQYGHVFVFFSIKY